MEQEDDVYVIDFGILEEGLDELIEALEMQILKMDEMHKEKEAEQVSKE
jgi:hypothetical protein